MTGLQSPDSWSRPQLRWRLGDGEVGRVARRSRIGRWAGEASGQDLRCERTRIAKGQPVLSRAEQSVGDALDQSWRMRRENGASQGGRLYLGAGEVMPGQEEVIPRRGRLRPVATNLEPRPAENFRTDDPSTAMRKCRRAMAAMLRSAKQIKPGDGGGGTGLDGPESLRLLTENCWRALEGAGRLQGFNSSAPDVQTQEELRRPRCVGLERGQRFRLT